MVRTYDLPFMQASPDEDLSIISLAMVDAFFGRKGRMRDYEDYVRQSREKTQQGVFFSIDYAIAAARLGYDVRFFSTAEPQTNGGKRNLLEKDIEAAEKKGVVVSQESLSLDSVIEGCTITSIPLVLLRHFRLVPSLHYDNHHNDLFPVVGHDDQHVFIHHPLIGDEGRFMILQKERFERARDSDVIFVKKKRS